MALSKQDRNFYQEKLGWKSFGVLFTTTVIVGAVMTPIMIFMLDWSQGQAGKWSISMAIDVSMIGFCLGVIMAVILYFFFKFLLSMGWLPSRR
jgi:hypothetical protein